MHIHVFLHFQAPPRDQIQNVWTSTQKFPSYVPTERVLKELEMMSSKAVQRKSFKYKKLRLRTLKWVIDGIQLLKTDRTRGVPLFYAVPFRMSTTHTVFGFPFTALNIEGPYLTSQCQSLLQTLGIENKNLREQIDQYATLSGEYTLLCPTTKSTKVCNLRMRFSII